MTMLDVGALLALVFAVGLIFNLGMERAKKPRRKFQRAYVGTFMIVAGLGLGQFSLWWLLVGAVGVVVVVDVAVAAADAESRAA